MRSPLRRIALVALAGAVCASAAPGWRSFNTASAQSSAAALVDLRTPAELKARFNQDRGSTRLVLLVSPT